MNDDPTFARAVRSVVPRSQGAVHRGDNARSQAWRSGYDDGFTDGWLLRSSRPAALRNRAQRLYGFVGFLAGVATAYGVMWWLGPVL